MVIQPNYRPVNPLLGTSFATFASAIAGAAILLAIFEQLGVGSYWLGHIMLSAPVLMYVGVGLATRTVLVDEYYVSGRRVPAFYNGLATAASAVGGVGLFAVTGSLFLIGYDALSMVLGLAAGLVVLAILFAPYLRKMGCYSVPAFLGQRYDSRTLQTVTSLLLLVPAILLLTAELKIGAALAEQFTDLGFETLVAIGAVSVALTVLLGGIRGLTWSQSAQFIVAMFGFLTPLIILAAMHTNLPLPQVTYAGLLQKVNVVEAANGLVATSPGPLSQSLPSDDPMRLAKPFLQPFGAISWVDFTMLMLCFMLGIAAMPSMLARAGTSVGVAESRRGMGWGLLLAGLLLISMPAYAVFTKYFTLQALDQPFAQLPGWLEELRSASILQAEDQNGNGVLDLRELSVTRDGVLLILPFAGQLPFVLVGMAAAAGLAMVLAGAGAQAVAVGSAIGDGLFHGVISPYASGAKRLLVSRLAVVAALGGAGYLAVTQEHDVLRLAAWSLSLSAAGFFPAFVMAIWWKRSTALGVGSAMLSGMLVTAGYIGVWEILQIEPLFEVDTTTAAVFGFPVAVVVGVAVSLLTPEPRETVSEIVDEIRVPGGETVHDRSIRLASHGRTQHRIV